jgi:hypothetical protein
VKNQKRGRESTGEGEERDRVGYPNMRASIVVGTDVSVDVAHGSNGVLDGEGQSTPVELNEVLIY